MNSKEAQRKADRLQQDTMMRMRWRLWFAFAESPYEAFRYKGRQGKPNYATIKEYCRTHWHKEPGEMTLQELRKCIAIVGKWKITANGKNKG